MTATEQWLRRELQGMLDAGCDAVQPEALEREIAAAAASMPCFTHGEAMRYATRREDAASQCGLTAIESIVLHALQHEACDGERRAEALHAAAYHCERLGGHAEAVLKIISLGAARGDRRRAGRQQGQDAFSADVLHRLGFWAPRIDALGGLIRAAMPVVLPRFFECLPRKTERFCYEAMKQRREAAVFRTVAVVRPSMLTLTGDTIRDIAVAELLDACPQHALRGADPHVYGSALLRRNSLLLLPQLVCHKAHCRWWGALCDWLTDVARRLGKRPRCGSEHSLVLHLCLSGRFAELVRLCAAGVITGDTPLLMCNGVLQVPYTADDIAAVLAKDDAAVTEQPDHYSCADGAWSPYVAAASSVAHPQYLWWPDVAVLPNAAITYIAHLQYLKGSLPQLWCPLPRWTAETHAALYRRCCKGVVRDAVCVLFLLHETRASSNVARLPFELLFHLFDWLAMALCHDARDQRRQ